MDSRCSEGTRIYAELRSKLRHYPCANQMELGGGFYYIPREAQLRVLRELGRDRYIKLPKPGTNPRDVEISGEALSRLIKEQDARSIEIVWQATTINYDAYKRWVDYWKEE